LKEYFDGGSRKEPRTIRERLTVWPSRFGCFERYFRDERSKDTPLRTIRNKTAFHYDKLNLAEAVNNLAEAESRVYLAQHPANGLYYVGSALVFGTVFAMIADKGKDTAAMTHGERIKEGVRVTLDDVNHVNLHMHEVLYGLIASVLEKTCQLPTKGSDQIRVQILDAPRPTKIVLPMFIDVGLS
jgi:hypothetical protein